MWFSSDELSAQTAGISIHFQAAAHHSEKLGREGFV